GVPLPTVGAGQFWDSRVLRSSQNRCTRFPIAPLPHVRRLWRRTSTGHELTPPSRQSGPPDPYSSKTRPPPGPRAANPKDSTPLPPPAVLAGRLSAVALVAETLEIAPVIGAALRPRHDVVHVGARR